MKKKANTKERTFHQVLTKKSAAERIRAARAKCDLDRDKTTELLDISMSALVKYENAILTPKAVLLDGILFRFQQYYEKLSA